MNIHEPAFFITPYIGAESGSQAVPLPMRLIGSPNGSVIGIIVIGCADVTRGIASSETIVATRVATRRRDVRRRDGARSALKGMKFGDTSLEDTSDSTRAKRTARDAPSHGHHARSVTASGYARGGGASMSRSVVT